MAKMKRNSLQVIETQKESPQYPPVERPIRKVRDARRLLSKLIAEFRAGKVEGSDAKTLTYMLISYVAICKDTELEERITQLESTMRTKQ